MFKLNKNELQINQSIMQGTAQTAVALVGRFGIAASFNMIFLYTTELFPTVVRSAALGTCSLVVGRFRFG